MGKKRDRGSDVSRKDKKKKSKKRDKIKVESEEVKKEEDGSVQVDSQINNHSSSSADVAKNHPKKQPKTTEQGKSIMQFDENKPIFFRKKTKLSISLLPWSLRDCKQSVESSIRKMLLKYSDGLGGILMAYDDIKLQDFEGDNNSKGKGWVLNELPHVHYDVSCNVLVFSPSVGCEVR
jgi:hypothetical protein